MYSVVLMAALTTGGSTPNCHWNAFHGCHGCHGGCYGGCYGGCSGGGCAGCNGSYSVSWYGLGYGCYGYAGYTGLPAYGCYGCYGGYGCYGASSYSPIIMPVVPSSEKAPAPKVDDKKKGTALPAPARLLVQVPADAKLYIDNRLTKATSASRTFTTPVLMPGQVYYYEVKAEVVRDGKVMNETKRILVRAGQDSQASFNETTMLVAAPTQGN
jgi:uncharacterized protein (TIGR03000 family)